MSHHSPDHQTPRYNFFVLGLWHQSDRPGRWNWRLSLENPRTGERMGFVDLAQLVSYLQAWMEEQLWNESDR